MIYCDTYFIGYDAREHEAACVAAYSIQRRTTRRSRIFILEHQTLRSLGLFSREWLVRPDGQFMDTSDGRPFSTAFSHSRFLAFHLANALKCTGPCMFLDCDWLFLDNPGAVMQQQEGNPERIGVVSRTRTVDEGSKKMDGMVQSNYERKLWSAMFTFMPSEAYANLFTPEAVSSETGRHLHSFMNAPKDWFWEIDPAWHFIPSLDDYPEASVAGIHFSEYSPWLNPDYHGRYPAAFDAWLEERAAWLHYSASSLQPERWDNLRMALLAASA